MKIEGMFPFRLWALLSKDERDRAEKELVEVSESAYSIYAELKGKTLLEHRISNGKWLDGSIAFKCARNETDDAEDMIDEEKFFDVEFPGIGTAWAGARPARVLEALVTFRVVAALVQKGKGYLLVKIDDLELCCPLRGAAKSTSLAEALIDVGAVAGPAASILKAVTDEIATCQLVD